MTTMPRLRHVLGALVLLAASLFAIPGQASADPDDLTVRVAGGSLTVTGNNADNHVWVHAVADPADCSVHPCAVLPGVYDVFDVDPATGIETLVERVSGVTRNIKLALKGGDDSGWVSGGDPFSSHAEYGSFDTEPGVLTGDIIMFGDAGEDTLSVSNMEGDDVLIKGGAGDDWMSVCAFDGDDTTIRGQSGSDQGTIGCFSSVDKADINLSGGNGQYAGLDSVFARKKSIVRTGSGADSVGVFGAHLGPNPLIVSGSGDDHVTFAGPGIDSLSHQGMTFSGKLRVLAGAGNDWITGSLQSFNDDFEDITPAVQRFDLLMAGGNDNVSLYSAVSHIGRVDGGPGVDSLEGNADLLADSRKFETLIDIENFGNDMAASNPGAARLDEWRTKYRSVMGQHG